MVGNPPAEQPGYDVGTPAGSVMVPDAAAAVVLLLTELAGLSGGGGGGGGGGRGGLATVPAEQKLACLSIAVHTGEVHSRGYENAKQRQRWSGCVWIHIRMEDSAPSNCSACAHSHGMPRHFQLRNTHSRMRAAAADRAATASFDDKVDTL